jgi:hypothetical protein
MDTVLQSLQSAVYAALTGDATLDALLDGASDGVFDAIPEASTAQKYVLVGEGFDTSDGTLGRNGHDVQLTVHCYTEDSNKQRGNKTVLDIANRVIAVLDGAALTVSGHTLVTLEMDSAQTLPRDGLWRHVVIELRAFLED